MRKAEGCCMRCHKKIPQQIFAAGLIKSFWLQPEYQLTDILPARIMSLSRQINRQKVGCWSSVVAMMTVRLR